MKPDTPSFSMPFSLAYPIIQYIQSPTPPVVSADLKRSGAMPDWYSTSVAAISRTIHYHSTVITISIIHLKRATFFVLFSCPKVLQLVLGVGGRWVDHGITCFPGDPWHERPRRSPWPGLWPGAPFGCIVGGGLRLRLSGQPRKMALERAWLGVRSD